MTGDGLNLLGPNATRRDPHAVCAWTTKAHALRFAYNKPVSLPVFRRM